MTDTVSPVLPKLRYSMSPFRLSAGRGSASSFCSAEAAPASAPAAVEPSDGPRGWDRYRVQVHAGPGANAAPVSALSHSHPSGAV